jgi:hypothetical protein
MNTNDQPTSILIKKILTAPFTRVGSSGTGDSTITLWQDIDGEQAIETNGDPVLSSDYGFDQARRQIVGGDYQDYTVTLSTDPSQFGSIATHAETKTANDKIATQLEVRFPGIAITIDALYKITGPTEEVVEEIQSFIDGIWMFALEA